MAPKLFLVRELNGPDAARILHGSRIVSEIIFMSLRDTIRVIQPAKRRIKLFVDFWNVVIRARNQCKNFDVEVRWDRLADFVVNQSRQGHFDETTGELAGCYVFGSMSKSNSEEKKFVENVLDNYGSTPGLFFNFSERIQKQTDISCSQCGSRIKTNSESGVDVLLSVEMIKHATMREHEYLALVSSDRDFLPLVAYLRDQGHRVLHVATGAPDREMRSITWTQLDLNECYTEVCRVRSDNYVILTHPRRKAELEQIKKASPVPVEQLTIIDITNKSDICDGDLDFILRNQNIYWRINGDDDHDRRSYGHRLVAKSMHEFRKRLLDGDITGNIPYVMLNGEMEFYFNNGDSNYKWIRARNGNNEQKWLGLFK